MKKCLVMVSLILGLFGVVANANAIKKVSASTSMKTIQGTNANTLVYKKLRVYVKGAKTPYTGIVKKYNHHNKLWKVSTYLNGNKNGTEEIFSKDGLLRAKFIYKDGYKHGEAISYFRNSKIRSKVKYINGHKEGIEKKYHKNGKLKETKYYVNGYKEGKETKYSNDGKLKKVSFYHTGEKISKTLRYKDGKLVSDKSFWHFWGHDNHDEGHHHRRCEG